MAHSTCKAISWDVLRPEDGEGPADSFTSNDSGSGLETVCPGINKSFITLNIVNKKMFILS